MIFSKQSTHQYHRYVPAFQIFQIVIPVIVFYPKHKDRLYDLDKLFGMNSRVHGQVKDIVCPFIIFSHLVSGGRIKRKQEFAIGMVLPKYFQNRSALFKFAERSAMHPYNGSFLLFEGKFHFIKNAYSPFEPAPGLDVPGGNQVYDQPVRP